MNTENIVRNLRLLWRADKIIAEMRLRHMLVGFGLLAFAALLAAFALLMFQLAAYFALVGVVSAITAAAILGAVNLAISLILVLAASRRASTNQELGFANEIHDAAIEALQIDAKAVQAQVDRLLHHPLEGALPLIVPLITAAISHLRKPAAAAE
ncbi:phage holin family protein [Bradyrhizobium lablabi]|uniref:phage holin family protein n=1 Tax=Bradyrhizobium lablabi TaxID=722472 RepID=UPI001BA784A9|nr:phage holin family protein [Bradyrhizobium lablabi]MBR1125174.1 phage holin family protein [Bradyrhizobium lablabi]